MPKMARRALLDLLAASGGVVLLGCHRRKGVAAASDTSLGAGDTSAGPADSAAGPDPTGPIAYLRTNWSQDPYAQGAYSHVSKNSPGTGESDRATVESPIDGRLFFAGEALNPNDQSSVHAAHESGLRAVAAVQAEGHRTVAVIGAGMAGLTTAHGLDRAGVEVTVLDARDRIGGRVHTSESDGRALDLGAAWIHGPDGNPLTPMADAMGMARVETDDTYILRDGEGEELPWRRAPDWFEGVINATASGVEDDAINLAWYREVYSEYGVGYSGRDVKFPNGYGAIFGALAGGYDVRLSTPVARIAQVNGGVEVTLESGATTAWSQGSSTPGSTSIASSASRCWWRSTVESRPTVSRTSRTKSCSRWR